MKKVLIIAHDYPPLNSIGAQRPFSWFKYFPENDLYPIVFAKNWNAKKKNSFNKNKFGETHLICCENFWKNSISKFPLVGKYLRKGITFLELILKWKFVKIDSTRNIYYSANEYLKNNDVDIIIATGEPWINFRYAHNLSNLHNVPWIADYRDGWNTNVSLEYDTFSRILSKIYFKKIERKIISNARALSFSDPCESLKISNIISGKEIITPLNGYDNELIDKLKPIKAPDNIFTVSYAGTIYDFQDLESFLIGLNKFINKRNVHNISVNLIGSKGNQQTISRINKINPDLFKYVTLTSKIPQLDAMQVLKSSHVLLLLANKKHVALPAKLFEYIGLERTILVSTNDRSDVERIVTESESGVICNDWNDVYYFLSQLYDEYLKNSNFSIKVKMKEYYSRKNQAIVLSRFIKNILEIS